jgi:DNA-binding MarR family transcriptional regulator
LLALKSNQAGLSQTELGKMLIVAKPNLVGMIDNLQKLGYVDRATNLQDRRLNTIQITLTGTQFVTRLEPLYEENIAQLLKDIDDGQKQDLIEFMEQLRKNVIDIDL